MIKVIVAGRRKAGMSRHEMQHHALARHTKVVQTAPGFWQHCQRYVQNHIIGQVDFETGQVREDKDSEYDVCSEFWFDSIESATKAWASQDYREIIRPDELRICDPDAKFLMLFTTEHLVGGSNPLMARSAI